MKNKVMMIVAVLLVGAMSGYGVVVAAWDFSDFRVGVVPKGWTTWTSADMSNMIPSSAGGLTLSISSKVTPSFAKLQVDATGVWANVDAPLMTLGTDEMSQSVYEDGLVSMSASRDTKITLSGLIAGQTYQIQFLSVFMPATTPGCFVVKQDGVAAAEINSAGVGTINDIRLIYSAYYTFTATASDRDVVFGITSVGGQSARNGLVGMMVNTIPEPETVGMLDVAGVVARLD